MKTHYGNHEIEIKSENWYNAYRFNWDNINSFDDFKKAMILKEKLGLSKSDENDFSDFLKEDGKDFDKYFKYWY